MKAHLMHRDRDCDWERPMPPNEAALVQDLELEVLFRTMAGPDDFALGVVRRALLHAPDNDRETVLYRQAVLRDCLKNPGAVGELHALAVAAFEEKRKHWLGIFGRFPSSILGGGLELLEMLADKLGRLRVLADRCAHDFASEGFTAFFAMVQSELPDAYLAEVKRHLRTLRFSRGVLISAGLGEANGGTGYRLREMPEKSPGWIRRLLSRQPAFTFRIAERDEAGGRALVELKDRGLNPVANAVAQSADHVLGFFEALRAELTFYLSCVRLHDELVRRGVPVCFPEPAAAGRRRHRCDGLRDVGLALTLASGVVGNDLRADGRDIVVVTGANQGGKSTFLRSVGLAQLMMQSGMFVAAESFQAELCRRLFTHYKREEDKTMTSGKFDEELKRMSETVEALTPDSLVLLNESFAATNEREGSEIAGQIVRALREAGVKIFYVTHLYTFAHGLWSERSDRVLCLNAAREADGRRTFKLLPGEPSATSFGADLYRQIFASPPPAGC